MKTFQANFYAREDGDLRTKRETFEAQTKKEAVIFARRMADERDWRLLSVDLKTGGK